MKFLLFSTSLLFCLFSTSAFGQSVGQSCAVNGRTQMSATASEGLIQCRSGTWASASQTVSSGGSSTPITAIMQYEKTLVTTVDACTDAMVGFKGFNPQTGRTMVCGGASFGWRPEITAGMTAVEKCGVITSGGNFSFSGTEVSLACGDTRPPACLISNPAVLLSGSYRRLSWNGSSSANAFCRQMGFTRLYTICGLGQSSGWDGGSAAVWNGTSWQHSSDSDNFYSNFIPCE